LHVKGLSGAHFLVLPEAFAFARPAKCKDRRQHGAQKSEWQNRMSLQGNYLGQIELDGFGCVKLSDVFTVWWQPIRLPIFSKSEASGFKQFRMGAWPSLHQRLHESR
jgi:hypothetical protein